MVHPNDRYMEEMTPKRSKSYTENVHMHTIGLFAAASLYRSNNNINFEEMPSSKSRNILNLNALPRYFTIVQ